MAFSSGTFSLYTPGNPTVSGTTISSTWANNTLTDIASGLSTCVLKDGTQTITANIPMSTFKITGLGDPTAAQDAATKIYVDGAGSKNAVAGRLTLTSGTAITTADVSSASTIYFTPFRGNTIAIYDGTQWDGVAFSEVSVTVPATTSTPFDVFATANSGTLSLIVTSWTNDTTRATALTTQDGVLVKSGTTTQRYLGSGRTTSVSGDTEDSKAARYLWNYYNRVPRTMQVTEGTDTWTYTTAAFHQTNATSRNQLELMIGVSEDMVGATAMSMAANTSASASASGLTILVGIGLDATNTASVGYMNAASEICGTNAIGGIVAQWYGYPGIGRHFLAWLEYSEAMGATTWYGDNGSAIRLTGISGVCYA